MQLFDRLNAIPRLSRDEELALIRRAKAGDVDARGRVLAANLRVTCMVAMRYRHLLRDRLDDAIAHGSEGLIQALTAFDPELDPEHRIRFATYAYDWVRRYIARPLFFRDDVVRRPEGLLRSGKASRGSADLSLDSPVDREDGSTGVDMLASNAPSPEDLVAEADEHSARRAKLHDLGLARLDERSRYILTEMIMADEPSTARHVAQQLGLSRQRVQQLRDRALSVLAGAGHHGSRPTAASSSAWTTPP